MSRYEVIANPENRIGVIQIKDSQKPEETFLLKIPHKYPEWEMAGAARDLLRELRELLDEKEKGDETILDLDELTDDFADTFELIKETIYDGRGFKRVTVRNKDIEKLPLPSRESVTKRWDEMRKKYGFDSQKDGVDPEVSALQRKLNNFNYDFEKVLESIHHHTAWLKYKQEAVDYLNDRISFFTFVLIEDKDHLKQEEIENLNRILTDLICLKGEIEIGGLESVRDELKQSNPSPQSKYVVSVGNKGIAIYEDGSEILHLLGVKDLGLLGIAIDPYDALNAAGYFIQSSLLEEGDAKLDEIVEKAILSYNLVKLKGVKMNNLNVKVIIGPTDRKPGGVNIIVKDNDTGEVPRFIKLEVHKSIRDIKERKAKIQNEVIPFLTNALGEKVDNDLINKTIKAACKQFNLKVESDLKFKEPDKKEDQTLGDELKNIFEKALFELANREETSVKKKDKKEIKLEDLPKPPDIKQKLDEYVIGQDEAKIVLSVAVYNHLKRIHLYKRKRGQLSDITKANIMLIGPSGSGKTLIVKTIAQALDVPITIVNATSFTQAGYVGEDVDSILDRLLVAADQDTRKAERGIVFIDEVDKIAVREGGPKASVGNIGLQQAFLKMIEGEVVRVGAQRSKSMFEKVTEVDTQDILFVFSGTFVDLRKIIDKRIREEGELSNPKPTPEDLIKYGLIPEFVGRIPVVVTLEALKNGDMERILVEPKNSLIKQYQKLFKMDDCDLKFTEGAIKKIAELSTRKGTGARGLQSILEYILTKTMYEIPTLENLKKVEIDEEVVLNMKPPIYHYK